VPVTTYEPVPLAGPNGAPGGKPDEKPAETPVESPAEAPEPKPGGSAAFPADQEIPIRE
jgi:hypothetical protein